jgi:hypothetical protein
MTTRRQFVALVHRVRRSWDRRDAPARRADVRGRPRERLGGGVLVFSDGSGVSSSFNEL